MDYDDYLVDRNMPKVEQFARSCGVESVIFTGQGEPTLNMEYILKYASVFKAFPLEVQTNGLTLCGNPELWSVLVEASVDIVSISMDSSEQFDSYKQMLHNLRKHLVVRLTVNASSLLGEYMSFKKIIDYANSQGVHQVCFRRLTAPSNPRDIAPAQWIKANAGKSVDPFLADVMERLHASPVIRVTETGLRIVAVDGISVAFQPECIQEAAHEGETVRSLIFREDGHLYTTWNRKSSIIF